MNKNETNSRWFVRRGYTFQETNIDENRDATKPQCDADDVYDAMIVRLSEKREGKGKANHETACRIVIFLPREPKVEKR